MLDTNSIFSNSPQQILSALEAMKWRSRINLWLNTCFWRVHGQLLKNESQPLRFLSVVNRHCYSRTSGSVF